MGNILPEFNEFYEEDSLKYHSFTLYKHVLNICFLTDTICPPSPTFRVLVISDLFSFQVNSVPRGETVFAVLLTLEVMS